MRQFVEEYDLAPDEKGRKTWQFCFDHGAMMEVERLTDMVPFWATLTDERETATRLIKLAFAGTISFRKAVGKNGMTLEEFHGLLPDLLSPEWFRFQDFINNLVTKTFPQAAGDRMKLQTLRLAQMAAALGKVSDLLIGTIESGPQSTSSECLPMNSGTNGTG